MPDATRLFNSSPANAYLRLKEFETEVNFVVIPTGRNLKFGFWLQAADSEEARQLVALNVPGMAGVTNTDLAQCTRDDTYSPMHGLIIEGSGRGYTITRRSRPTEVL
jgi:hypothetical protein